MSFAAPNPFLTHSAGTQATVSLKSTAQRTECCFLSLFIPLCFHSLVSSVVSL